ncbi:hypothetical protein [Halosegnis longus]|uniref:hypothetical protein n=1 Tax=Halosegnis longus TaxID=2216012 RepID=UPI00129E882A|nr:hypothetical protein [Halosegnis longus]
MSGKIRGSDQTVDRPTESELTPVEAFAVEVAEAADESPDNTIVIDDGDTETLLTGVQSAFDSVDGESVTVGHMHGLEIIDEPSCCTVEPAEYDEIVWEVYNSDGELVVTEPDKDGARRQVEALTEDVPEFAPYEVREVEE